MQIHDRKGIVAQSHQRIPSVGRHALGLRVELSLPFKNFAGKSPSRDPRSAGQLAGPRDCSAPPPAYRRVSESSVTLVRRHPRSCSRMFHSTISQTRSGRIEPARNSTPTVRGHVNAEHFPAMAFQGANRAATGLHIPDPEAGIGTRRDSQTAVWCKADAFDTGLHAPRER